MLYICVHTLNPKKIYFNLTSLNTFTKKNRFPHRDRDYSIGSNFCDEMSSQISLEPAVLHRHVSEGSQKCIAHRDCEGVRGFQYDGKAASLPIWLLSKVEYRASPLSFLVRLLLLLLFSKSAFRPESRVSDWNRICIRALLCHNRWLLIRFCLLLRISLLHNADV